VRHLGAVEGDWLAVEIRPDRSFVQRRLEPKLNRDRPDKGDADGDHRADQP
jgi:hypothetical protein